MPMLTEEEVRHYLGGSATDVQQLVKKGKLTAYRLGGTYVRYRKEEVLALKNGKKFVSPDVVTRSSWDRFIDFWKFYSFYIISTVVILGLVLFFLQF